MSEKKSRLLKPEELMQRLGESTVLEAIFKGGLTPHTTITEAGLKDFKSRIDTVLAYAQRRSEERAAMRQQLEDSGDVYVVQLHFPQQNVMYLCLYHHGKILSSGGATLDINALREHGLAGFDSQDRLLDATFGSTALPAMTLKKHSRRSGAKAGTTRKVHPPRRKPFFVIDPTLAQYLRAKEPYLTASTMGHGDRDRTGAHKIEDPGTLADLVGADMVLKFVAGGFSMTMQTSVDWVVEHRRKIQRSRKARLNALMREERVHEAFRQYCATIKSLLDIKGAEDMVPIYDFMSASSNARHCYDYFAQESRSLPGISLEEIIDTLRYNALEGLKNDPPRADRVNRSMGHWIAVAKAARFVMEDPRIKQVVSLFEEARSSRQEDALSERVYEGMRLLATHLLNQELRYSPGEFHFIVDGLWLKGYFTKRQSKTEKESDPASRDAIDREIAGVKTQYVYPLTHLMKRYAAYHAVLSEAYDRLLNQGSISNGLALRSQSDDRRLGLQIYTAIPEDVQATTFLDLKAGTPLRAPSPEEWSRGTQLTWIVQYYVAVNRDQILKKARDKARHDGG